MWTRISKRFVNKYSQLEFENPEVYNPEIFFFFTMTRFILKIKTSFAASMYN